MTYNLKLNRRKLNIDEIFVYAFFAVTLYMCLFQYNRTVFRIYCFILAVGALRGYAVCIKQKFSLPVGMGIFFSSCWVFCLVMRCFFQPLHEVHFRALAFTICYIGLAVLLLNKSIGLWGSSVLLIVCAGVIVFRLLTGVATSDIVINGSRNYVSIIMLFCILLYYLALYQSEKRGAVFVLLPAVLFFAICVAAYGRGGILASGFFLLGVCVYKFVNATEKQTRKRFRIFLVIVAVLVLGNILFVQQGILLIGKFSTGLVDQERLEIWANFFRGNISSVVDFLCGADVTLLREDGNLHNSFFQCYAWYGVIGFCGLLVLSVKAVVDGIKNRDLFWTILILTLFIRAFTDMVFFTRYCELFLYYFLMYWRYQKKNISVQIVGAVRDNEDNS